MTWIYHPKFVRVTSNIITDFKQKEVRFFESKPIVFLCGGNKSPVRDRVYQYLASREKFSLFYADDVWTNISKHTNGNALQMEEELAKISDAVIIVVESPGTFAELGAFSLNQNLRKKLIPILNKKHEDEESFINTGPVHWINEESSFSPVIWANFNSILECAPELDKRLNKIKKSTARNIRNLPSKPKFLLLFLCDLIAVFGPCKLDHIKHYYKLALNSEPGDIVTYLIGLASAMNLIKKYTADDDENSLFYRSLKNNESFRMRRFFHLPELRTEVLSVLLSLEDGRNAMNTIREK